VGISEPARSTNGSSRIERLRRRLVVRLILFAATLLALLVALQVLAALAIHKVPTAARGPVAIVAEIVVCVTMIIAYRSEVRLIERRKPAEILFDRSTVLIFPGAFVGILLFVIVYAILWAFGVANYAGPGAVNGVPDAFAGAMAAAIGEEIVFRGVIFRIVEEGMGTLAAIVLSAMLFGLLHAANPGATPMSTAAIALEAGVLLSIGYAATRTLWFPIGMHFGWNFTEGGIFSAAVSGGESHGLLNFPLTGPAILTGGAFGPEASIVAVMVCLAASGLLCRTMVLRGLWRPFSFTQPRTGPGEISE
jgi:membrane protease YdiL (CAAX protease family)